MAHNDGERNFAGARIRIWNARGNWESKGWHYRIDDGAPVGPYEDAAGAGSAARRAISLGRDVREGSAEAVNVVRLLSDAIVETVSEAGPLGAPAGVLLVSFIAYGLGKRTFDAITDELVEAGKIRRDGDLFFATLERG